MEMYTVHNTAVHATLGVKCSMCMFVRSMYVRWMVSMYPAQCPRSTVQGPTRQSGLPPERVSQLVSRYVVCGIYDMDADTDGLDRNRAILQFVGSWALGAGLVVFPT